MNREAQTRQADATMKTQSKPTAEASRGPKIMKTKVLGKVDWFNANDGYGFIKRSDTAEEVFFHYTAIVRKDEEQHFCSVEAGQKVLFDIIEAMKGPKAINITGPGGVLIQGKRYEGKTTEKRMMKGDGQKADVKNQHLPKYPVKAETKITKVSKATMTTGDLSQDHLDEFLKMQEERERLKEEMEALKDAMKKERAALRAKFDKDLQAEEEKYQEKLEAHKAECRTEVKEKEERLQHELDSLKNTMEEDLAAMRADCKKNLQAEEAKYQEKLEAHKAECRKDVKQEEARLQGQLDAQKARFTEERESKTDKSWMYIFGGVCLVAGVLSAKILTK